MITNPKHGWCNFELSTFQGTPSYITDVPVQLLDAFIDYHKKGGGVACFDEEGSEFTLILTQYSLFIIEERASTILHDFSELKIRDLEDELIHDIEDHLDEWADFEITIEEKEIQQHKKQLKEKLFILKNERSTNYAESAQPGNPDSGRNQSRQNTIHQ